MAKLKLKVMRRRRQMAWAAQNNEAKEKGAVASSKKIEEIAPKAEMSTK